MTDTFDPYHKWLGIRPDEQPADYYRLIGITRFEDNLDVISNAVDARMAFIRTMQSGGRSAMSQKILNELSQARVCLLDPNKKSRYDQQLKSKLAKDNSASTNLTVAQSHVAPNDELVEIVDNLVEIPQPSVPGLTPIPSPVRQPVNNWGNPAFGPIYDAQPRPKISPLTAVLVGAGVAILFLGFGAWFFGRSKPAPKIIVQRSETVRTVVTNVPFPEPNAPNRPKQFISPTPTPSAPIPTPPSQVKPSPNVAPTNPFEPPTAVPSPVPPPIKSPSPPSPVTSQPAEAPAPIPAGGTGNLLRVLPASEFKLSWKASIRNQDGYLDRLIGQPAQIAIPVSLPANYELEVHAVQETRDSGFGVSAVMGGRKFMVWFDAHPKLGYLTYISELDGLNGDSTKYAAKVHRGQLLALGKLSKFLVRIRGTTLQVACDDRDLIAWQGDPERLRLRNKIRDVPGHQLIGTWDGGIRIKHVEVRPLGP